MDSPAYLVRLCECCASIFQESKPRAEGYRNLVSGSESIMGIYFAADDYDVTMEI